MMFSKETIIPQDQYIETDIIRMSKNLLGKVIVCNTNNSRTTGMIVETEAYRAPDDKGSHAYLNRRTNRTETIFKNGGVAYVYLCYGLHNMLNVVTGPVDTAHAILIRAIEPLDGLKHMSERRNGVENYNMTNGPGKLCQAMGITRDLDSAVFYEEGSPIQLHHYKTIAKKDILCTPRVGIAYAQECAHWNWRFRIDHNPWTSKPDNVVYPT